MSVITSTHESINHIDFRNYREAETDINSIICRVIGNAWIALFAAPESIEALGLFSCVHIERELSTRLGVSCDDKPRVLLLVQTTHQLHVKGSIQLRPGISIHERQIAISHVQGHGSNYET